jgi:hypothetical protein
MLDLTHHGDQKDPCMLVPVVLLQGSDLESASVCIRPRTETNRPTSKALRPRISIGHDKYISIDAERVRVADKK